MFFWNGAIAWCFFTFSYPSHLKHLVVRAFLEDGLPEMLSKLGVLAERGINSIKKIRIQKKTSRDSSDCQKHMVKCQVAKMLTVKTQWTWTSKIGKVNFTVLLWCFCRKCGVLQCFECTFAQQLLRRRLWMSGSALAELWEALGELWEALYIEELPINRPSGHYVTNAIYFQ